MYGIKNLKLLDGEIIEILNVVRMVVVFWLIYLYYLYCEEFGFSEFIGWFILLNIFKVKVNFNLLIFIKLEIVFGGY